MNSEPVDLHAALASFDVLWSPRIVTHVNDYDVRIAKVAGEHVWHVHENTDEFFLVLDGELTIAVREPSGERTVVLPKDAAKPTTRQEPSRHHASCRLDFLSISEVYRPGGALQIHWTLLPERTRLARRDRAGQLTRIAARGFG